MGFDKSETEASFKLSGIDKLGVTYRSMQTDTSDSIDTYRQTTSVNLLILHNAGPSNHPLLTINWTISGIPINMIIKSAVARFIIKMLVTDCRIFLSNKITIITRLLPMSPTAPITMNSMDKNTITSPEAGSTGTGEILEPFISMSELEIIPDCRSYPGVVNCTIASSSLSDAFVGYCELSLFKDIIS